MKGLIEERFSALAFMEKLQRRPGEARLTQKLLDCGFSPALIKKLAAGLTDDAGDETAWATQVLERNLRAGEADVGIDSQGGVFALVGATGVGKTTTTAKIAAAFAARHGASNLGLITLDAYRVGAHEQLRAYGRILGVPVHTAHDRASLEDLLELLGAKKMVLIDTAGMAQRDSRTRELLDMLSHRTIQRLLVVNAAAQGETIEDVLVAYKAASCAGIVLSKIDEAVKLRPGARRRDPPQAEDRRRRQRPARARGLAPPVGERAGAAGDARRRQRRLALRRGRHEPGLRRAAWQRCGRRRDRRGMSNGRHDFIAESAVTDRIDDPRPHRPGRRPAPDVLRLAHALRARGLEPAHRLRRRDARAPLHRLRRAPRLDTLVVDAAERAGLGRRDGA